MQMKQPRFDSVNARFSLANAFLESLRTKKAYEASVLRFGSDAAFGNHPDPAGSWAAFRKGIPLRAEEFEKIAHNVAPYLRESK